MKRRILLFFCCLLLCPSVASAADLIRLKADRISFYYDRFLVEADGDVAVELSNGIHMRGQAFSMDLKLNRFLLAGSVMVNGPTGALSGAAVADFLDFKRLYFIPIIAEPDRWTYLDNDFSRPLKGREMPGDAFAFPDLSHSPIFLTARRATIGPNSYASFSPATLQAGPVGVPAPSFVVNFSPNPNLVQNSLSGAQADLTYPFAGSANSISAAHLRYDTYNRLYASFEQHIATPKAYAVFSLNPATRPSKFWNLLLSDQIGQRTQIHTFTQLHTFQSGLSGPVESSQFTNVAITQAFTKSYLQISTNFFNQSLLSPNDTFYFGDPSHSFNAAHPFNGQISLTAFDQRIGKLPLYERLRYGLLYAHDEYGIQGYAQPVAQPCTSTTGAPCSTASFDPFGVGRTLWQNIGELTLYTPSLKIAKDTYLNLVADKTRTWGPPHYVDTTNTTLSASRTFGSRLATYVQYGINNLSDVYGANQRIAYPSYVPNVSGTLYPGFAAFQGLATYRTATAGFAFTPNPDFALSVAVQKHNDFPNPIPFYYGNPPYTASADLRVRVARHAMLDISRSYYFNYANQTLSPQFAVQVLP